MLLWSLSLLKYFTSTEPKAREGRRQLQLGYTLPFNHSHCEPTTDYLAEIPDPCHRNPWQDPLAKCMKWNIFHGYKLVYSLWQISCSQETGIKCETALFHPMQSLLFSSLHCTALLKPWWFTWVTFQTLFFRTQIKNVFRFSNYNAAEPQGKSRGYCPDCSLYLKLLQQTSPPQESPYRRPPLHRRCDSWGVTLFCKPLVFIQHHGEQHAAHTVIIHNHRWPWTTLLFIKQDSNAFCVSCYLLICALCFMRSHEAAEQPMAFLQLL